MELGNISATVKTLVLKNTAIATRAAEEPPVVYADASGDETRIHSHDNILEDTKQYEIARSKSKYFSSVAHHDCPGCEASLQGKRRGTYHCVAAHERRRERSERMIGRRNLAEENDDSDLMEQEGNSEE